MSRIFLNRQVAGHLLAKSLSSRFLDATDTKIIMLALPRGGVPIAHQIAKDLSVAWDVLIVRKIGHPTNREFGVGAVTEDGTVWFVPERAPFGARLSTEIDQIIYLEKQELRRRQELYRAGRALVSLHQQTVIIVDDGLATGATALVGARFALQQSAKKVIVAVPVGSPQAIEEVKSITEHICCLEIPRNFQAVSRYYQGFPQVSDEEVLKLLAERAF